jgi:hypothetical protein
MAGVNDLCAGLGSDVQDQGKLKRLAVKLRKSNRNLFLNFSILNDLINIQNDTFTHQVNQFHPKNLVTSTLTQVKELTSEDFNFNSEEIPDLLFLADTTRIEYILSSIFMKSAKRNNYYQGADMVKVMVCVKDQENVGSILDQSEDEGKLLLRVVVVDHGEDLNSFKMKE